MLQVGGTKRSRYPNKEQSKCKRFKACNFIVFLPLLYLVYRTHCYIMCCVNAVCKGLHDHCLPLANMLKPYTSVTVNVMSTLLMFTFYCFLPLCLALLIGNQKGYLTLWQQAVSLIRDYL